jgi:multiple sugar transport system permease protein
MLIKNRFLSIIVNVCIAALGLLMLLPVLFIFANSLMSGTEIIHRYTNLITPYNWFALNDGTQHFVEMGLLPRYMTFREYYYILFQNPTYLRLFWNSVLIVVPIVLGQCLISFPAAYAFEQMRWRFKEALYFIYIIVMLMPLQVLLVPNFIVADFLNINHSYLAIILPAAVNPFGVFLIRQQLKGFPKECMEAARLDGASEWKLVRSIVAPNFKSTVSALAILTFAEYWNVVDQAVVFIRSVYKEPISVYLSSVATGDTGRVFALSCFYMIPAILIFLYGQDHIIKGIALSGVKN